MSIMSLEEKKIEDKTVDHLMDKFTSNLDADDIVDKCLSKGLITENDLSRISKTLMHGRTTQAVRDLMLSVKRSAPGYLKTFCDILNDSKSGFLVPCIEEEYCSVQSEAKRKLILHLMPYITYTSTSIRVESETIKKWEMWGGKKAELISELMEHYFHAVHQRQGIFFPEKESNKIHLENGHLPMLQAVPNMLLKVGDVLEDASVEASVEKCKKLHINSDNVHSQFTEYISTVLDTELTWKKIVMFFSSVAGFGIHLCTNNMSHLATQIYYDWMPQIMQYRLQPWIDDQGGWVSTILG